MLNIKGKLYAFDEPLIMGIVNVTPDSFYSGARYSTETSIRQRLQQIIDEGADIVDVGACSTRPGAEEVTEEEELRRLTQFFEIQTNEFHNLIISVDTYRSQIARICVEQYGAAIINDISGGDFDANMFETIADLHVPYILTHIKGMPQNMQDNPLYDNLIAEIQMYFSDRVSRLHYLGVHDIILDPGFGFGKTLDQNYQLMSHIDKLKIFDMPLLVGISRKSMIYKLLSTTPEESQNGTTVLNTVALLNGAQILRVHDVKAAVEAKKIVEKLSNHNM